MGGGFTKERQKCFWEAFKHPSDRLQYAYECNNSKNSKVNELKKFHFLKG